MNSAQAKQLSMPDLLSRLGHEPVITRKGGKELWYHSPFRSEAEPSFVVSPGNQVAWIWNDFGDIGGTIIDFAMRYNRFNRVGEALDWLEKIVGKPSLLATATNQPTLFSFNQQPPAAKPPQNFSQKSPQAELAFLKACPIQNKIILRYLTKKRAIPQSLIERYLLEVRYRHIPKNKQYFAFGMRNISGGYEIRAATDAYAFKSALDGRAISVWEGVDEKGRELSIFEGMLDFLSLLALRGVEQLEGDAIILHSLSSFNQASAYIEQREYQRIHLFLDNDAAGAKTTQRFTDHFGTKAISHHHEYEGFKDLNAWLAANREG